MEPFCRRTPRVALAPHTHQAGDMPQTPRPPVDDQPLVDRERQALADLLDAVGPDAKTLCGGWSTRDLAAHLVLREGHPAAVGIVIPRLSGWTTAHQKKIAATPFAAIVERFRNGPPMVSPFRLPGVGSAANTFEYFVHHEDVRRAQRSWVPRVLAAPDQRTLWQHLSTRARLHIRNSPVPVRLQCDDFGAVSVGNTDLPSAVTLTGEPAELVLYVHGRRDESAVDVDGSAESVARWLQHSLAV